MDQLTLKENFGQFIEFGKVFDRDGRDFMVRYLAHKLLNSPKPAALQQGSNYFRYFARALDRLLENEKLLKVSKGNERMGLQILEDLLKWIRKVDRKLQEDNPHHTELQRFEGWSHRPTFLWKQTWPQAISFLKSTYAAEELDADFYRSKMKHLMPEAPNDIKAQESWDAQPQKPKLDILIDDLLAQWDALLSEKILRYQMDKISEEAEGLGELLNAKVDEYTKLMDLINPFATEAGRFWDLSRGLWKDTSFDILEEYDQLLQNEDAIRELADLLGRMREAEIELEEEIYEEVVVRKEWVADETLPHEVTGIQGSNDLNRMLPSEAALLADGETTWAFFQKYADRSLLSFQRSGKKLVTSDKVAEFSRQKQKKKEKGPFILCVDTSGSMFGKPSQIAKILCFAIMKMAAKEQRKCYLINFSIGIKTINLSDLANSMDKVVEFLSMSFDGGTDVTPALSEAVDMLQTNEYQDADVLMVSDFVMFSIRKDILERIKREQHKGTCFHSLTIANKVMQPNPEVLANFDNCWAYDPESQGVIKQMLQDLHDLGGQRQAVR